MKNAVIFTGLPRNIDRFEKSVSEMRELSRKGLIDKIIFSTWRGRVKNNPEFGEIIEKNSINLVKNKESPVGGKGNVWHQMRSLEYGLDQIDSDYRILRTRSDVHIDKQFLCDLFDCSIISDQEAKSEVFEEKIWTPFATVNKPFYLCDYCFFGTRTDLKKLINFDSRYKFLYNYNGPTAEVQRWSFPYLQEYGFLEKFWLHYEHDSPIHCKNYSKMIESRINSSIYGLFLSFYFKILISDFYFNSDPITFRGGSDLINKQSNIIEKIITYGNEISGSYPSIRIDDHEWLENELANAKQDYPKPITTGLEMTFDDWRELHIETAKIVNDTKRDRKFFDITEYPEGPKAQYLKNFLQALGIKKIAKIIYSKYSGLVD